MRVAICGGTFDPFHRGHLEPLLAIREAMAWSRIVYVPAHRQPFKLDRLSAPGPHRFAMAVLATESRDDLWVDSWELEQAGVSYSVDTLEHLRAELPEATFDFVIGDDNLSGLERWKSLDRIFELANFVVLARGGASVPPSLRSRVRPAAERPPHGAIMIAANRALPVSSTEIRLRIAAGEPVEAFVEPRVRRYIQHNRLYQPAPKGIS